MLIFFCTMGGFNLKELTDATICVKKSSMSNLTLQKLPPELLAQILLLLPGKDIANAAKTCKGLNGASLIDFVWQQRCLKEFGIVVQPGTKHMSCRELYTKCLYKYGSILGFWQPEITSYGGLVEVKHENGQLSGVEWLPPKNQEVLGPLRCIKLFSISQDHEGVLLTTCQRGYRGPHKCLIVSNCKQRFCTKCCEPDNHRHPQGEHQEFTEWMADETNNYANMLMHELLLMKFIVRRQYEYSYEYKKLEFPLPIANVPIQPGLFKGTYGTHGLELVMLQYEEDGTKAIATKITGDPNVPAAKVTFKADLRFPIILDADKQRNISDLEHLKSVVPPTSPHKLPMQPFRVPDQCVERAPYVPQQCKARFYGYGQIAGHGFTNPSFTPGHWIVFNEDLFGFLWLELLSLSLFHRARDVGLPTTHTLPVI